MLVVYIYLNFKIKMIRSRGSLMYTSSKQLINSEIRNDYDSYQRRKSFEFKNLKQQESSSLALHLA